MSNVFSVCNYEWVIFCCNRSLHKFILLQIYFHPLAQTIHHSSFAAIISNVLSHICPKQRRIRMLNFWRARTEQRQSFRILRERCSVFRCLSSTKWLTQAVAGWMEAPTTRDAWGIDEGLYNKRSLVDERVEDRGGYFAKITRSELATSGWKWRTLREAWPKRRGEGSNRGGYFAKNLVKCQIWNSHPWLKLERLGPKNRVKGWG